MDHVAPPQPFADLTPHAVLDAMADIGLYGDGRLLHHCRNALWARE